MGVSKIIDYIQIKIEMPNPSQELTASSEAPNGESEDMDVVCSVKSRKRDKIWNMGLSKTIYHIQIKIKPQSGASSIIKSPKPGPKGH